MLNVMSLFPKKTRWMPLLSLLKGLLNFPLENDAGYWRIIVA